MNVQNRPDGSLLIRESFVFLRTASVGLICLCLGFVYWLARENVLIETKGIGWAVFGVSLFCLIGMILDDRSFVFDASQKKLVWKRSNLFRSRGGTVLFSDIRDAVVSRDRSRDDDRTGGAYKVKYSAVLVTANGNIPLTGYFGGDKTESLTLVDKILAVLAIPDKNPGNGDDIDRLIAAGQMLEAVTLIREQTGLGLTEAHDLAKRIRETTSTPAGSR